MILKLKSIGFTTINVLFLKDVDINNVLVTNQISSGNKKKIKYFAACMMIIKLSHNI